MKGTGRPPVRGSLPSSFFLHSPLVCSEGKSNSPSLKPPQAPPPTTTSFRDALFCFFLFSFY